MGKNSGQSSFKLQDKEEAVTITVNKAQALTVKWTPSAQEYLFNINRDKGLAPKRIIFGGSNILPLFSTLNEFHTSDNNGWFNDANKYKLWIKANKEIFQDQ